MKTFERRMAVTGLEVRDEGDNLTLTGYASTFNQPYDMGWYTEQVHPEAFSRTLSMNPDVQLLINHTDLPLASTASGTLSLRTDKVGLLASAKLDRNDPDVARVAPKMARGDVNKMSFAFRVVPNAKGEPGDAWSHDMTQRTLRTVDIDGGDVSIVGRPANPGTSASLRAGGRAIDAISSAMRSLEYRAASDEDIVSVLTRALGYFSAIDMIVDGAQDELADALGIPNPDVEEDADLMTSEMQENAAQALLELRKRLTAVL